MSDKEIIEMELVPDDELEPTKNKGIFARKINPEWMPQIMEWAAQGFSLVKIADKVKSNYKITITSSAIHAAIKKVKIERSNVSKSVVRENISTYIVNDLEVIKLKKDELVILSDKFKLDSDWKNYFQSIDKIKDYSKMIFELSGVNENQIINEAENAKQDLLEMFEKFQYGKLE